MMKYLILIILITLFSCTETKEDRNQKNLEKVKIGMNAFEVEKIMGVPDTVNVDTNTFDYKYHSTPLSSSNYFIYFDKKDSLVITIINGS